MAMTFSNRRRAVQLTYQTVIAKLALLLRRAHVVPQIAFLATDQRRYRLHRATR